MDTPELNKQDNSIQQIQPETFTNHVDGEQKIMSSDAAEGLDPKATAIGEDLRPLGLNPEINSPKTFTDLLKSRFENTKKRNMTRGEEEVRFWGAAAVIGAIYPFTGGVTRQSLESAKQIAEIEGLVGLGAFYTYGVYKWAKFFQKYRR